MEKIEVERDIAIVALYAQGLSAKEVGEKYGISDQRVLEIVEEKGGKRKVGRRKKEEKEK